MSSTRPPSYMRLEEESRTDGEAASGGASSSSQSIISNDGDGEAEFLENNEIDYAEYKTSGNGLDSVARVTEDGRIAISFDLKKKLPDLTQDLTSDVEEFAVDTQSWRDVPPMSIVIMIVGSRGDVQPYLALGNKLKKDGHRVRLATHETFRSFVQDSGLEFFNIGGNPQELMSYMVKNPGIMPGMVSMANGDIGRKRTMLREMILGCWKACYEADSESGRAFAADAIISNPPAFAHVHCAEALGIPLLLTFTMPWTPTAAFPHPLVNISKSNADKGLTNSLSYALAEILTWQGVGDIINTFRTTKLGLGRLNLHSGPGLVDRLRIPWTYCMSPALIPKPKDWKNHIDVVGFYFLDLASDYQPPEDLVRFLEAGSRPIYIGFGSVVVKDSKKMSEIIFDATKEAGVRALVSAGWGGLGGAAVPDHIFMLGNIPHDWLFDHVSAVVHHGGAGTTAIGLKKGKPTVVVPFFGDQPFWGMMINRAGAGPSPIHHTQLNVDNLRDAIKFAVSPEAQEAAAKMAQQIANEDGVARGVESFYRHLPLLNMRCDLDPTRLAVWWSLEHRLRLSAFAAQTLADAGYLDLNALDRHRSKRYTSYRSLYDPSEGGFSLFWGVTNFYAGMSDLLVSPVSSIVQSATAIPKGIGAFISSKDKEREDMKTGIKEGFKGYMQHYSDAITGLVREPMNGAKSDGIGGALRGTVKGIVGATFLPLTGVVGLVTSPIIGARTSLQRGRIIRREQALRETYVSEGVEAVRNSGEHERRQIIKNFKRARKTDKIRKSKEKDRSSAYAPSTPPTAPPCYESSLSTEAQEPQASASASGS